MGQSKFEIKHDSNKRFIFSLKAGNGEVILKSGTYTSKQNCKIGIVSVTENAVNDKKYERKKSSNNKHYFNLKAGNGEIIGTSEMYDSAQGMENGISSVKSNSPIAEIKDFTLKNRF